MSLLVEIQSALMEKGQETGPIFLKLRYLAARLGSDPLEEWVKHESEGYPNGVPVPEYRKLDVSYTANFSGPFGAAITNAPIPPTLIKRHAGKHWVTIEIRQSIVAIDDLISASSKLNEGGSFEINAADLILRLQGNVYKDYACNSVVGKISPAALAGIQHVVRTRILELTLEFEKRVPAATEITLGPVNGSIGAVDTQVVTQITNQVINGNVTTISSSGAGGRIVVQVGERDREGFEKALNDAGIPSRDAKELAEILESEEAEGSEQPWGSKARAWLAKNIGKAADGTWNVGLDVATKVMTEAAMQYYNLK